MKTISQQFVSVLLAILLLASTVSWTVEKHYCMGHIVDLSLFGSASSCGMPISLEVTSEENGLDSCCEDEIFVVHGQDDLKFSQTNFELEEATYLLAFTYVQYLSLQPKAVNRKVLKQKLPPLLVEDIQLLDQVFLI